MKTTYNNILIIALRKIGDTIIATSGAYLLRQAYPKAKITMLVKPLTEDIVKNNPVIDEVMLYNYTHKTSIKDMKNIVGDIKRHKFDLCVVLDNKPRSAMLAWLADIPNRIGFEKIEFRNIYLKLFYTKIIKINYNAAETQQVKNHEIFINQITKKNSSAKMVTPEITVPSKAKVDKILSDIFANHNGTLKIALCIRTGCFTKDWPLERFKVVIEALAAKYKAVFIIIGSHADREIVETFCQNVKGPLYNICGQTSLPELGYVFQNMDFFLSLDTGSAHIAAAVDIPMVEIFGSTSPAKWGAYSDHVTYIAPSYPCNPCDGKKIKCVDPCCLTTISAENVTLECIKKLDEVAFKRRNL